MTVSLKTLFTKRIILFIILGLITFVLYFNYFVGTIDVITAIKRANLLYYTAAFIAFLAAVFFSSLTWQSLLSNLSVKTSIRRVLLFMWVGMFFDVTVPEPGWSGDLSKAYLLAKTTGQESGKIVASVVGQKVIGMVVTIVDLILGVALLAWSYALPSLVLTFVASVLFLSIFSLFIVVYLSANPRATKRILDWLVRTLSFIRRNRWNSLDFRLKAEKMLNRFHEGIRTLSADKKALVRPMAFSLLSWTFDVSVVFLVFAALGYAVPVDKVLIVYALTGTLQSIGVSFLGFTEIIMSSSYTVLGIPPALSLSAVLLTRVVTLWFKLIVAYLAFQWAGVRILRGSHAPETSKISELPVMSDKSIQFS
jgi:uncharacterized protein (TIRG00374 family)